VRNLRVLNYFGSKVKSAHRYPAPRYHTIIEPFAGGAGYSLLHHTHDVILIDKSPDVIGAWQWLIAASRADVLALPLIKPGQDVHELDAPPGGRLLISWCLSATSDRPRRISNHWSLKPGSCSAWRADRRTQMATIAERIKHWSAFVADYSDLPNANATWFIDPPYSGVSAYPHHTIDYKYLASWSREREGQAIVCERDGATWLPFAPLYRMHTANAQNGMTRCAEAVWLGGVQ
jgi:site-specific DNA-adenine methylase